MVSSRPRRRPGAGEGEQNMSLSSCLGQKPEAIFLRWINIFHLIRTPHRKFYLLSFIILIRNAIKTCVVCLPCARQKPRLIKCYCHPCLTCLGNLHQPLHTGPLCTFILSSREPVTTFQRQGVYGNHLFRETPLLLS